MNELVLTSEVIGSRFDLDALPIRMTSSIDELQKFSARKLLRTGVLASRLAARIAMDRPDAVYFTLAPIGGAFYRDCAFIAIMKAFRVPRIYHLHGKGIAAAIARRGWLCPLYKWAFRGAHVIHLSPRLARDIEGGIL